MEWEDGNEYPVIRLDVSSDSHPFYTGRQNSLLRMVVWNVSTKVWSPNQTTTNYKFKLSA